MASDKIIELVRKPDGKYQATADSLKIINSEKKERVFYQRVSEKKARSSQQNRYYWSVILRIVAEYIDKMDNFITYDVNGNRQYDNLHRYLSLKWAVEESRDDLISQVRVRVNGQWCDADICSFSFDKMKHEDATAYTSWIESKVIERMGCGFEMILQQEKMEVQ